VEKDGHDLIHVSKRALLLNITKYFQEVLIKLYFMKKDIEEVDWLNFNITPGKKPKECHS